jgi:hypothetical protein
MYCISGYNIGIAITIKILNYENHKIDRNQEEFKAGI